MVPVHDDPNLRFTGSIFKLRCDGLCDALYILFPSFLARAKERERARARVGVWKAGVNEHAKVIRKDGIIKKVDQKKKGGGRGGRGGGGKGGGGGGGGGEGGGGGGGVHLHLVKPGLHRSSHVNDEHQVNGWCCGNRFNGCQFCN